MTPIVYEVSRDSRYRVLVPVSDWEGDQLEQLTFGGNPKRGNWEVVELRSHGPKRDRRPDIWELSSSSVLVFRSELADVLTPAWGNAELLPVTVDGEAMVLLNVLDVIDAIDLPTSFDRVPAGSEDGIWRGSPDRYVFLEERLPRFGLFKIPSTSVGELLCVQGEQVSPARDFKRIVEDRGLSGLRFEERWRRGVVQEYVPEFLRLIEQARAAGSPAAVIAEDRQHPMGAAELDDRLWLALVQRISSPEDVAQLPATVRAYFCTRLIEWDIANGGLGYAFGASEPYVEFAIAGYRLLGDQSSADLLAAAKHDFDRARPIASFDEALASAPWNGAPWGDERRLELIRDHADDFLLD